MPSTTGPVASQGTSAVVWVSTPSPAEPYNFQAGHSSSQAKTRWLPAPQGPRGDGMGERGTGWEGTAPLQVTGHAGTLPAAALAAHQESQHQVPFTAGRAVPWAGDRGGTLHLPRGFGLSQGSPGWQVTRFTRLPNIRWWCQFSEGSITHPEQTLGFFRYSCLRSDIKQVSGSGGQRPAPSVVFLLSHPRERHQAPASSAIGLAPLLSEREGSHRKSAGASSICRATNRLTHGQGVCTAPFARSHDRLRSLIRTEQGSTRAAHAAAAAMR